MYGEALPCLDFAPQNTIEWPILGNNPAAYGRLVIAELDGDQAPEGVAVEDGIAVAFWKLAVYDASEVIHFPTQPTPTNIGDIATLPGGGSNGCDAVLMTDARGLFRVTWANGAFQDPVILATGSWINAAPIHVDDVDLDGLPDVIGLSSDKRKVLARLSAGNPPELTVTEPLPARDVVAVDWNEDGTRELVVLSTRWLRVHNGSTGALVDSEAYISLTGCVARIRRSPLPGEILAWTRIMSPGVSQLVLIDDGGIERSWRLTFEECDLGDITPTALLTGDYDQTGTEELVLVHQASQTAIVLANQGAPTYFLPNDPLAFDVIALSDTPSDEGGVGIPALGQIDGVDPDGSGPETAGPLDLAFPVSATSTIQVFLYAPYERAILGGPTTSATIVLEESEFGFTDENLNATELRFALEVPTQYRTFTHLDVILWPQEGHTPISDLGIHRLHPFLTVNNAQGTPIVTPLWQWVHVDPEYCDVGSFCEFGNELCWDSPQPNFYTEFRFVKNPGANEIRSPIFTGGFTIENCYTATDYDYLITQGIPDEVFDLEEHQGLTQGSWSRDMVGRFIPMSSHPPFSGGTRPPTSARVLISPAESVPN